MRKVIFTLFVVMIFLGFLTNVSAEIIYPKLAIYSTSQTLHPGAVKDYSRYHLIIMDYENWTNNPESIALLREEDPSTKILAYGNPIEVYYEEIPKRPLNLELTEMLLSEKYQDWWLWTDKKEHAVFYDSYLPYRMVNMSSMSPKIDGQKWNEFIAHFYIKHALKKEPRPDGFFGDNAADNWYWTNEHILLRRNLGWIDANLDGLPDEQKRLDDAWRKGMEEFYTIIREEMGEDFLVIGNKGNMELMNVLDGKMFEEFPFTYGGPDKRAGGWYQNMEYYLAQGENAIIQIKRTPSKEHLLFGLASALLGDGYFAVGHNFSGWFPEFETLGRALGPHQVDNQHDIWYRVFEKGLVKVYPELRKGEIIRLP